MRNLLKVLLVASLAVAPVASYAYGHGGYGGGYHGGGGGYHAGYGGYRGYYGYRGGYGYGYHSGFGFGVPLAVGIGLGVVGAAALSSPYYYDGPRYDYGYAQPVYGAPQVYAPAPVQICDNYPDGSRVCHY